MESDDIQINTGEVAMTQRNERRPASEVRRERGAYPALADPTKRLLFFSLLAAVSFHQAFGRSPGLYGQPTRQARNKRIKGSVKKEIRKLRESKPISSGLVIGQEHAYRIELDAGKFLKVIVEQKGIDLTAEVSGPDGKQFMEFDSEIGAQGREEVSLVAEAKGAFQLILRPKQYGSPAGSYDIRIEELREATEADRELFDARKQFNEALKLRRAGKYDEALPPAERAMEIRERWLGAAHRDVAAAINLLADIHADKSEYAKAEPLYQRALAIREKALGKDHPDIAQSLNSLANIYRAQAKYVEAEPLINRSLKIRENALGKDDPGIAESLDTLAALYYDRRKYKEAERVSKRALQIREKSLDEDRPSIAQTLNNLAEIYREQKKYVEAEPLYKQALGVREKALGKEHPSIAESLNYLAVLYHYQRKYVEAEPLYKRALEIGEKALGKDHSKTGEILGNMAVLYYDQGKYVEAEPLYKRSLEICEKAQGKDHPATATAFNNLAFLYTRQGRYVEAEPLYKRALEIQEKTLGKDDPVTAGVINNLAQVYHFQGRYVEAEPLYKRALEIREKTLGKGHPQITGSLNNLAALYYYQGKYVEAEAFLKQALESDEKSVDKDPYYTTGALNNLAGLYGEQGRYVEAEALHKRLLDIREKTLGKDHPETSYSLHNLAVLYREQGRYVEAEELYNRALAIRENKLGKDHPDTADTLNNLGILCREQGRYVEAEGFYNRALAIRENKLGKDHPSIANSFNNLAVLHMAKGDLVQAVKFQSLANAAGERNLTANLVTGSERDKLAYLATLTAQTNRTISLHVRYAPDDPVARNLAATLILQRKGRALDATSQNLNALRSRFNDEDRALLDRLIETREQIARLVLGGPRKMSVEQHQAHIKELEDQADKDEADISRRSTEFRAQYLPVTLEAVRAAIPDDSALIEFATYRPFNAGATKGEKSFGQPRYVAYVLRHGVEIKHTDLGEAKAIDTAIEEFRNALRDPKGANVKRLGRAVDEKVFQPVRRLLGDKSRLLISPDGPLNLIPFPALVDERGRYAVERYSISYLTSGRDLLRLQVARESKGGPIVVAAPDFGRSDEEEALSLQNQEKDVAEGEVRKESAYSVISDFYFPPLPAAAQEGEALRALLPGATLLTKGLATKAALNQIHGPKLLHIATHGFFLEDQQLTLADSRGAQTLSDNPKRALRQLEQEGFPVESPLLRSGLVLAGANKHKEDDNGILTALEVTGLNLWGTKLVTLSACDTGVGKVKNGDGVYGLRRALVLAGAEAQIISLWPVSDRATQELMVSYYRKLQEGQGRGEALRQAQLEMFRKVNRRHPYYWACFIQSGEWANLEGKR
jgi:CHAT domain-containing protein/Tfp pilus assembly protein PilF